MASPEERPGFRDLLGWIRAYPKLHDPLERVIWWSVLKKFWLQVLVVTLVIELVWQTIFKAIVLLFYRLGLPDVAWFFD
jgi:hypothetical protein